jgi:NitT/TauT family transport system substrate-binding protein
VAARQPPELTCDFWAKDASPSIDKGTHMLLRTSLWIVLLAVVLAAPVAGAQQPIDLTFFLTFVPNIQFAPVYVAIEKGYFAEQGINLTVEYGEEPDGMTLIAAGERQFGIISGEQVIQARANGLPVVYVYQWFQKFPIGIVSAADSGIASVADLVGRRVGIPGRFGASYSGLVALLASANLVEADVQLEEIGFNAADVFCVGGVEASVVYVNNEPLQIEQRAQAGDCGAVSAVSVINVADAVGMVSNGIVTNEQTAADNPELVSAVVGAFDRALRDTIDNPASAYLFSARQVENLPLSNDFRAVLEEEALLQDEFLTTSPDREAVAESRVQLLERLSTQFDAETLTQFRVLLNTIDLWDAERLGVTDLASWEVTQQTLITMGFLPEATDLSQAFTLEFLPPAG